MENFGLKYNSKFYTVGNNEININLYKDSYSGDINNLICTDAKLIYNYRDFFTPIIGSGFEWSIINNSSTWSSLDELLTCTNREWYVETTFTPKYKSVFNVSTWINDSSSYSTFNTSNWNITSAIGSGRCYTPEFEIHQGDKITLICNATGSGIPIVYLATRDLSTYVGKYYTLYSGYNNIELTSTYSGNVCIYMDSIVSANYSLTFTHDPSVTIITKTLFEGYLLPEEQEQTIMYNSEINLKASNQLAQLENLSDPSTDDIAVYGKDIFNKIIVFIYEILDKTGLEESDIYVNNSVYETTTTYGKLLSDLYLNKHLFCDSDITYDDLYKTLNNILKPFNLFVYRWDKIWYIERIFDFTSPRTYTIYNSDYSYANSIGNKPNTIRLNTDFKYINQTQTLKYLDGYKSIVVSCNEKTNPNMVNESAIDAIPKARNVAGDDTVGQWYYDSTGSVTSGYDIITYNSVLVKNYENSKYGIYAKVRAEYNEDNKSLSLKWRRIVTDTNEITYATKYSFYLQIFNWSENKSFQYSDNKWSYTNLSENTVFFIEDDGIKYDEDNDYYYWEVQTDLDLSVSGSYRNMILDIRLLGGFWTNDDITHSDYVMSPTYSRIRITQSDDSKNTELTGKIPLNFTNKLKEEIILFDTTNYLSPTKLYKSRITYEDMYDYGTSTWSDSRLNNSERTLSLQKLYLETLFQQYNKPRKQLEGTIYYPDILQPFSIIEDKSVIDINTGRPIQFVLLGYDLNLSDMHYDIQALQIVPDDNEIIE